MRCRPFRFFKRILLSVPVAIEDYMAIAFPNNPFAPDSFSLRVLQALEHAGLEAWFVGGWGRDALMGRPEP